MKGNQGMGVRMIHKVRQMLVVKEKLQVVKKVWICEIEGQMIWEWRMFGFFPIQADPDDDNILSVTVQVDVYSEMKVR